MLGAAGAIPNSKRPFGPMDRKSCQSLFRFGVGLLARLPPGHLRPLPKLGPVRQGGITSDNIPLSEPNPSVIGWIRLRCPAPDRIPFRFVVRFRSEGRPLSLSKRTFPPRISSSEMCQNVWLGRALQDGVSRPTNVRAATMY